MSTATAELGAPSLDDGSGTRYQAELQAVSREQAFGRDSWGAVITQLTADALVAATAAAGMGAKIGSGVHSATIDPAAPLGSAAALVSAQRMLIAAQLPDAAAAAFWSLLPLIPHLDDLRCPDEQDAADATAELLAGLELPERQVFLRMKAGKLATVAAALRDLCQPQDQVRATYRCDLLIFELAAIEAAAASGDQHLSTATVKLLLARSALSAAAGQRVFRDAASAIETERQILSWAMMGASYELSWLT